MTPTMVSVARDNIGPKLAIEPARSDQVRPAMPRYMGVYVKVAMRSERDDWVQANPEHLSARPTRVRTRPTSFLF